MKEERDSEGEEKNGISAVQLEVKEEEGKEELDEEEKKETGTNHREITNGKSSSKPQDHVVSKATVAEVCGFMN